MLSSCEMSSSPRKPFSEELHRDNDWMAKWTVADFLRRRDWEVAEGSRYGVDLTASKGDKKLLVEVEIKHGWLSGKFPFETLHIPARKAKFKSQLTVFCVLCKDLSRMLVVNSGYLRTVIEVPNKYVSKGEEFFDVPIKYTKEYLL